VWSDRWSCQLFITVTATDFDGHRTTRTYLWTPKAAVDREPDPGGLKISITSSKVLHVCIYIARSMELSWKLYSSTGAAVMQGNRGTKHPGNDEFEIDASHLCAGAYFFGCGGEVRRMVVR
jgi:hypothetical protein